MHDYFEILGLPENAAASEVRRASARRVHRLHPDFRPQRPIETDTTAAREPIARDAAIDFVDMASVVERMQAAFFSDRS